VEFAEEKLSQVLEASCIKNVISELQADAKPDVDLVETYRGGEV